MKTTPALLTLLACLLYASAARAEEAPAPDLFQADYVAEDLSPGEGHVRATGRVHIRSGEFELRIEQGGVVIWVDPETWPDFRDGMGGEEEKPEKSGKEGTAVEESSPLGTVFRELYAEGGVILRRGEQEIRAERLFFNFAKNRAVVLKGELLARIGSEVDGPRVPILLRAGRIYQTMKDQLTAEDPSVTTCLFADPHYDIGIGELTLWRRGEEYSFVSEGNWLDVGGIPIMWFPALWGSTELGTDPIRGVDFGSSSRYGTYGSVTIGQHLFTGEGKDEQLLADWQITPLYRSRRGHGAEFEVDYGQAGWRGGLDAVYQRDKQDEDRVTEAPIPRRDRGRVRWQHYHVLARDVAGGRVTGIGEVSWISDRNFLEEYESSEDNEGKAKEHVGWISWAGNSQAIAFGGRWRGNEFQTETEYRPRGVYDLFATQLAEDAFGPGVDLYLEAEGEAAKVFRAFDHKLDQRGVLTDRYAARGALSAPFSVGPVRVLPRFGAGSVAYEGGQDLNRLDVFGSVRASMDFWRVFPDVTSDLFQLAGLKHIVDLSAGYANRYGVSKQSSRVFVQDPQDLLDEIEAFDVRVRNRFQTKRGGAVVDWIDMELRGLFFPGELPARPSPLGFREEFRQGSHGTLVPEEETFRTIERDGLGPILGELRAQVRENLFVAADAWYDFETHRFETYSEGIRYDAQPELSFFVGHRAIQGISSSVTAWVDFELGSRWSARVFQQTDFRGERDRLATGLNLRRILHDFVVELRFRVNSKQRTSSFTVSIEPIALFESGRRKKTTGDLDFDKMSWYR
jgi:hypothetical protein